MTRPRATTSPSDALGATIADLKARLARMENIAHQHKAAPALLQPVGSVLDFVGSSAPTGWVLLDGQTLTNAETIYPELWSVAPTAWRSGSNLVLPDLRGRVTLGAGQGSGLSNRPLGADGGAETHTLTTAQIPSHTHDLEWGVSSGMDVVSIGVGAVAAPGTQRVPIGANTVPNERAVGGFNQRFQLSRVTLPTGDGGSHNNMQPFYALNKILKIV